MSTPEDRFLLGKVFRCLQRETAPGSDNPAFGRVTTDKRPSVPESPSTLGKPVNLMPGENLIGPYLADTYPYYCPASGQSKN
jgi:hypothetical protein